jgi:hypothetical protein
VGGNRTIAVEHGRKPLLKRCQLHECVLLSRAEWAIGTTTDLERRGDEHVQPAPRKPAEEPCGFQHVQGARLERCEYSKFVLEFCGPVWGDLRHRDWTASMNDRQHCSLHSCGVRRQQRRQLDPIEVEKLCDLRADARRRIQHQVLAAGRS